MNNLPRCATAKAKAARGRGDFKNWLGYVVIIELLLWTIDHRLWTLYILPVNDLKKLFAVGIAYRDNFIADKNAAAFNTVNFIN